MTAKRPTFNFVFYISLLFAIAFAVVASAFDSDVTGSIDAHIISFIQGFETPGLTGVMKLFTFIGSAKTVAVLSVLLLAFLYFVLKHRTELLLFVVVLGGTAVLNQGLKLLFHRERPDFHRLIQETGYSFPSGHSMEAFALYGVLAFLLWRHIASRGGRVLLIVLSVAMTIIIGLSRIYLGVHYPSDVLGSYLAGGFWLFLSVWAFQWYREYKLPGRRARVAEYRSTR